MTTTLKTVTIEEANKALIHICGIKAEDWLDNITLDNKTARRTMILQDYMFNSHSIEGIQCLSMVLVYLAEA